MVPEILIFLIDGVSIDQVLVVIAAAVVASAAAVTYLDMVNAYSGSPSIKNINISGTIRPMYFVLTFLESQEQVDKQGGCNRLHNCSH